MEKIWAVGTATCGTTRELVWTDGGDPSRPPWEGFGEDWIDCNTEENARLVAAAPKLQKALCDLLDRYLFLVNSGDAGYWDPETESEVIAARSALKEASTPPAPAVPQA